MKKLCCTAVSILLLILVISCNSQDDNTLVIYAYDSFVSEWGPGPAIVPLFEEATGYTVELESRGDAMQVISQAVLEKNDPQADVLIGVDNNSLAYVLEQDLFEQWTPESLSVVPERLRFDPTGHVTPYDYGYFSIIYDSETISSPPVTLEELTQEQWADSLILMDPRTSSPGLGFFLWTIDAYGEDFTDYWRRLEPSILTITDGWDSGYGLFTEGEAPMVLSYTTSPAYHVEYEDTTQYQAALLENGNYMQVEGMGILKGADNQEAARAFIEFALSPEFQSQIPLTNWMYPVNPNVDLPDSFEYAPEPSESRMLEFSRIDENRNSWIRQWSQIFTAN
ncbi:MAG: thiamine ABC transporter substrate binding subunit [Spirochaetia bacterium]